MMPHPAIVLPPNPGRQTLYRTPFSPPRAPSLLAARPIDLVRHLSPESDQSCRLGTPRRVSNCLHPPQPSRALSARHYSRRPVDWLTRIEFYRQPWMTWFLLRFGAIPVRRQGVSASGVRTAIVRLQAGRVVAIAPEGGVAVGPQSVCRGGPIKHGASLIAARSGKPIIPCVILGSHALNRVGPWLPFRRARLWIAFGDPIHPPTAGPNRKADRLALSANYRLSSAACISNCLPRIQCPTRSSPDMLDVGVPYGGC